MLTVEALEVLSALLHLGEHREAKKVARRVLDTAPIADLWTIARSADILDTHRPNVATARLDRFARELNDEQRAALAHFCRDNTGRRPRRAAAVTHARPDTLSVYFDTRPGYDEEGPQPEGLTVHPAPWEEAKARRLAILSRQLRTAKNQLPAHMRTEMRAITTTDPETRRPLKSRAVRKAERRADDYIRTRLGVEDHSAPPNTRPTVFDVDDDQPATTVVDEADSYEPDHDQAARVPFRTTPCVYCFIERPWSHDRNSVLNPQPASAKPRHDDGLCAECRADDRTGLPQLSQHSTRPASNARTVAYINPKARALARQANTITGPCAAVAAHLPPAAALVWMRAYYRLAPEDRRPIIKQWVTNWTQTQDPQPPTPVTPAIAPPAPVPALAAA